MLSGVRMADSSKSSIDLYWPTVSNVALILSKPISGVDHKRVLVTGSFLEMRLVN